MQILRQSEHSECGLVALAMLTDAHGLRVDLPSLRARFPLSLKGATLHYILGVARELGLETRAVRCELEELDQLRLPAILHWQMNHFVVLAGRKGQNYIIHDPAMGRVVVSHAEMSRKFTGIALEAWPGAGFQRADRRLRLRLDAVVPRSRQVVSAIGVIFAYALAIELISLLGPILQGLIIDDALVSADTELVSLITVAMATFLAGQAATSATRGVVQRNLHSTLSLIVPARLFRHMLALPGSWFESRSPADIANRLDSGHAVYHTLTTSVISAGIDGIVALIALGAMMAYSPSLTLVVIVTFLLYGLVRVLWYATYRQKSQGSLVESAKAQGILWETMHGIATIKTFNGEGRRHEQYLSVLSRYVRLQNGIASANIGFGLAHDLLFAAEWVVILYLGAHAVIAHEFSVGMLVAFLGFRENFTAKGTSLIGTAIEFSLLGIHLDRLADILLTRPENTDRLPFLGDYDAKGLIEVRDISFRYGASEPDVLQNCSFKAQAGEIVAIVGPSGSGKSTLFKILTGQLQPITGKVLIDGIAIPSLGLERWRDMIGVVRQGDMMFAGTITENIAFLDEAPDHERVRQVSVKARIHNEIQRMPMGYNTIIGSMGTGMSGGQAQRIMLARALYKQPRLLLLDEATSHLDLDNERGVSLALRDLGITQIIIAHRPETIAKADRVIDIRQVNGRREPAPGREAE